MKTAFSAAASEGFTFSSSLCTFLSVPVVTATVYVIAALVKHQDALRSAVVFGDTILATSIVSSALAYPLGVAAIMIGSRRLAAARRLRLLESKHTEIDPAALAELRERARNAELTEVAIWAVRISLGALTLLWFVVILQLLGF